MPGGKGNIKPEDGKPFSSENQPKNRGRKRKIYTILKEKGYSKNDIILAFEEMGFYSLQELKDVHTDESKPIIMRIIANQLFLALKKGEWGKIKEIFEYILPKLNRTTIETPDDSGFIIKVVKGVEKKNEG